MKFFPVGFLLGPELDLFCPELDLGYPEVDLSLLTRGLRVCTGLLE